MNQASGSDQETATALVQCCGVHHSFGDRVALDGIDLHMNSREIFALLGPNGSGKSTLFRLISTLIPLRHGTITIAGVSVQTDVLAVRRQLGVVFQSPSLDKKLTVDENLACQAALYGMSGVAMRRRRDEVLELMRLADRRSDLCETLSGGMKRRVELAKCLLHRPAVMLLDEPSTGLDPAARLDLWQSLEQMAEQGTAVVLTTHILEEADKADRIAILAQGKLIAQGAPASLRGELGQSVITIETSHPDVVEKMLGESAGMDVRRVHKQIRVHCDRAPEMVPIIADKLGGHAQSITLGRPSLEDVFIERTGHQFL